MQDHTIYNYSILNLVSLIKKVNYLLYLDDLFTNNKEFSGIK